MCCLHSEQKAEQFKFSDKKDIKCHDDDERAGKNNRPFQSIMDLPTHDEIADTQQDGLVENKKGQHTFIGMSQPRSFKRQTLHTKSEDGK